jgi:transcriptional regulator with XRE-family HTH domain
VDFGASADRDPLPDSRLKLPAPCRLAELLDTSPETVSRWERGVSRIDRAAFAILAGILMEKADDRSDTLERLRALRHPARLGQLVQIEA